MHRVSRLAEAAEIAAPTPELCLIAGLIIAWTKGKPKRVEALCRDVREFVAAHQELSHVTRLRGAEYDEDVLRAMSQAAAWLDRIEPLLLMMARR